jgi:hypothetical protein
VLFRVPTFDIFSGRPGDKHAIWLEKVEGLGDAYDRMKALAAENPGPYFIFHIEGHQILASINNTPVTNNTPKAGTQTKSQVA